MPEYAATVERKSRGMDLFIIRGDNVRHVRKFIPQMLDADFVKTLVVRRYTDLMPEREFDPLGVLAREREDQRLSHKIADPALLGREDQRLRHTVAVMSSMSPVQALDEVRGMVFGLYVNADHIRPEMRQVFRNGYAKCRNDVRKLLTDQIALIRTITGA